MGIFCYNDATSEECNIDIYAQSTGNNQGRLSIFNDDDYAISAKDITINGGNITANTVNAVAIYAAQNITINGGNVNATSDECIALYANVAITINGGNVNATSDGGNGIDAEGTITINGGKVTATNTTDGFGISANTVTISGGNVTANGNYYGINANGTITLGWTDYSDCITANSYGIGNYGTIIVKSSQEFIIGSDCYTGFIYYSPYSGNTAPKRFGTLEELNNALAGKTLYPYVATLDLTARQAPDQNYWTTFYCGHTGYEINADENACAYTAEYDAGNAQLILHNQGKQIPKGCAVIIVADNNEVSMTAATLDAFNGNNALQGVDQDTPLTTLADGTFYVLGNKNDHFGFHRYEGTEMAARKAFLLLPASQAGARSLDMVFGDVTGIKGVKEVNEVIEVNDDSWYTLEGRKLNGKPTAKGIYVNKGHKVVIK